jgi:hypothetical protein
MILLSLKETYAVTIASIAVGATPTVTTDEAHGFESGESVTLAGVNASLTGGANAAHIVTATGDKTFTIPITTGGTYTAAADTATKDVAGLLHGHADATIKSSSPIPFSAETQKLTKRARLLVHTKNLPGAGEEITIKAWGRRNPQAEWVLLATIDETGTFGQRDSGGLFGGVGAEFFTMSQMSITAEATPASANAFEAGILTDDAGVLGGG